MHRQLLIVCLLPFLIFASACSHDHRVNIEPELFVRQSDQGAGKEIRVKVIDTRSQRAIYKKDAGPKLALAGSLNTVNIFPASNLTDPVEERVVEGLKRLGFRPKDSQTRTDRTLHINIAHFKMINNYEKPGLKVPGVQAQLRTLLKVTATRGEQKYKKIYKSSLEKSHRVLSGKFKNEQFINNGLSLALQRMFEDPRLIQFLSNE